MPWLIWITLLVGTQYLFYLHGQIVEGTAGRPVHPDYGVYDYPAIVDAFEDAGFTVISEIRPAGTDGMEYAARVAAQVDSLIANGVTPQDISVVGMSKGGGIALGVSMLLENPHVNFVMTGTCYGQPRDLPPLILDGRVLMIHELSDPVTAPCTEKDPPAVDDLVFRRLRTNTGRGHGAFFRPDPEWMAPAISWCRGDEADTVAEVREMYTGYQDELDGVPGAPPDSVAAWLASGAAVLVDVRPPREREVSVIPGSITREEYEAGDFTGRTAVSYCTIGYRSGEYTIELRDRGIEAFNLDAGILGWIHDFRPVVHEGVEVRRVHVYGRRWNLAPSWYEAVW